MNKEDICYMPAWEMAEKIKTQEFTSLEITEILIERIEKINPIINAYCTPTFDLARDMAKKADDKVKKGENLGLLHGVPTSIKDDTLVKGVRLTFGCKLLESFVSRSDEIAVKRLKDSGVVLLGKTNMPSLGVKPITDNLIFGKTKNPWNLNKTPGGSSGGAAATIASGLCHLALGSDGGGSIRIPSSFCGVYGLKPHFGRIPQITMRTNGSLGTFVHKGPIVRYVKDAALMLDVLAGEHDSDRYSLPNPNISYFEKINEQPNNIKIGYSFDYGLVEAIDPEVEKSVLNGIKRFEDLGWSVEKAKIKIKNVSASILQTIWSISLAYPLKPYLKQWQDKLDPDIVEGIKMGLNYSVQDFATAEIQRELIFAEFCRVLKKYDIIITPTVSCTAFDLGKSYPDEKDGDSIEKRLTNTFKWIPFTIPLNLTGHPAASIPCGWSSEGLPIGMHIIGKRFDELTVLQVSKAFEEMAPWQDRRPSFT